MKKAAMLQAAAGRPTAYTGPTLITTLQKKVFTAADPWAMDAQTFTKDSLYLVYVLNATGTKPSGLSGVTGITFAELATKADDQGQGTLWWGVAASTNATQTLTVDQASSQTGGVHIVRVVHQALNAASPFTQHKETQMSDGPDNTHPTVAFAAPPTKAVICFAGALNNTPTNTAVTVGATALDNATAPIGIACWYDDTTAFLQTSAVTKSSGVNWNTIGVEMK